MRPLDIALIFPFIHRPGLFIGGQLGDFDASKMDNFLLAYELGSMNKCQFRQKLIQQIQDKYDTAIPPLGFEEQLKGASRKANKNAKEIFIEESTEILVNESDRIGNNIYVNFIRNELIDMLNKFPEEINVNWIINFKHTLSRLQNWPGKGLTVHEFDLANLLVIDIDKLIGENIMSYTSLPQEINDKQVNLNTILKNNMR